MGVTFFRQDAVAVAIQGGGQRPHSEGHGRDETGLLVVGQLLFGLFDVFAERMNRVEEGFAALYPRRGGNGIGRIVHLI